MSLHFDQTFLKSVQERMALAGFPVDMSTQLISYHINSFIKNGIFEYVGQAEGDKRHRLYRFTEHGRGCVGCMQKLVAGTYDTPSTEQLGKGCVLAGA